MPVLSLKELIRATGTVLAGKPNKQIAQHLNFNKQYYRHWCKSFGKQAVQKYYEAEGWNLLW